MGHNNNKHGFPLRVQWIKLVGTNEVSFQFRHSGFLKHAFLYEKMYDLNFLHDFHSQVAHQMP